MQREQFLLLQPFPLLLCLDQNEVVLFTTDWCAAGEEAVSKGCATAPRIPRGDILRFGLCVRRKRCRRHCLGLPLHAHWAWILLPLLYV